MLSDSEYVNNISTNIHHLRKLSEMINCDRFSGIFFLKLDLIDLLMEREAISRVHKLLCRWILWWNIKIYICCQLKAAQLLPCSSIRIRQGNTNKSWSSNFECRRNGTGHNEYVFLIPHASLIIVAVAVASLLLATRNKLSNFGQTSEVAGRIFVQAALGLSTSVPVGSRKSLERGWSLYPPTVELCLCHLAWHNSNRY